MSYEPVTSSQGVCSHYTLPPAFSLVHLTRVPAVLARKAGSLSLPYGKRKRVTLRSRVKKGTVFGLWEEAWAAWQLQGRVWSIVECLWSIFSLLTTENKAVVTVHGFPLCCLFFLFSFFSSCCLLFLPHTLAGRQAGWPYCLSLSLEIDSCVEQSHA